MFCRLLYYWEAPQNRCCTDQHRSSDPCGRVPSIAWSLKRYITKNFPSLMKVFNFVYVFKHFLYQSRPHRDIFVPVTTTPRYIFVPAIYVCTSHDHTAICLYQPAICLYQVFQTYRSCTAADCAQTAKSKHAMFRPNAERTDSLQFLHEDFQTAKDRHAACLRS